MHSETLAELSVLASPRHSRWIESDFKQEFLGQSWLNIERKPLRITCNMQQTNSKAIRSTQKVSEGQTNVHTFVMGHEHNHIKHGKYVANIPLEKTNIHSNLRIEAPREKPSHRRIDIRNRLNITKMKRNLIFVSEMTRRYLYL